MRVRRPQGGAVGSTRGGGRGTPERGSTVVGGRTGRERSAALGHGRRQALDDGIHPLHGGAARGAGGERADHGHERAVRFARGHDDAPAFAVRQVDGARGLAKYEELRGPVGAGLGVVRVRRPEPEDVMAARRSSTSPAGSAGGALTSQG